MEKLSQVLWHERELLETLLFRLEEEALVVSADCTRWWWRAVRDVDNVAATVRETDLLRAVTACEAALEAGLESGATLRTLASVVCQPWRDVLLDHRNAIDALCAEIDAAVQAPEGLPAGHPVRRILRRPNLEVGAPPGLAAFLA